jgi:hypothetical protein
MKIRHLFVSSLLILLTACNSLPVYKPDPDEKMVPVRVLGPGNFSICQSGVRYSIPSAINEQEKTAYISVPAGQKIGLMAFMTQDGYQHFYHCSAGVSFIPKEGQAYVSNTGSRNNQCFIELVAEDNSKETGVKIEPSVSPYFCASLLNK